MPAFSIIVPVYNAEKTLEKCLKSIRCQTFPDFEVLMIENGSQDGSNAICREYAGLDSRFRLYGCAHNCGPSGARNIGLDQAAGEFVAFVDSDDFVEPDYLETLLRGFGAADVLFFGYHQILTDGTSVGIRLPEIPEGAPYHETLVSLRNQDLFGYTWIKAFRRAVIGEHRFSLELNLMEDEVFACEVLREERRIGVIPRALYNYVTGNAGSLVGRTHRDYCRKADIAYCAWKALLADCDQKAEVLLTMANGCVRRCMYYGFERDVEVREFFAQLAECVFFRDADLTDKFYACVKKGKYRSLSRMRTLYRLRVALARKLKT